MVLAEYGPETARFLTCKDFRDCETSVLVDEPWARKHGPAREAQFEHLLDLHRVALSRLAASYARTHSDREDLVQEIAFALWRALPAFRGECSERTFLFRIAHNRCMTYVARRYAPLSSPVSLEDTRLEPPDPAAHSEARLADREQHENLLRAIRELPLIYREVVVLALEGLNYREISKVAGISETNVGARLSRARQQLRKALQPDVSVEKEV